MSQGRIGYGLYKYCSKELPSKQVFHVTLKNLFASAATCQFIKIALIQIVPPGHILKISKKVGIFLSLIKQLEVLQKLFGTSVLVWAATVV